MKNKREKVLALLHLPPPIHGVTQINSYIKASSLINNTFDIVYLGLSFGNIGNIGKSSLKKIVKMVTYLFKLLFLLIKHNPKLVYFTISPIGMPFYRDVLYAGLIKLFRKKLLLHLHGKGISREYKSSVFKQKLYNFVFNNSFVIHLAHCLLKDLEALQCSFKNFVLPNGIASIGHNKTIKKHPNSILFLSNLMRTKGIYLLLEAVSLLKKKGKNFTLFIAGAYSDTMNERQLNDYLISLDIKDRVKYLGVVKGQKKNEILSRSEIMVLPSYNECFPLVILEAYQSSMAVIASDKGAIKNIVNEGKNGFILDELSKEEIADKITLLLENKDLLKKMGERNYQEYLNKYSFEIFENNFIGIINEIIRKD